MTVNLLACHRYAVTEDGAIQDMVVTKLRVPAPFKFAMPALGSLTHQGSNLADGNSSSSADYSDSEGSLRAASSTDSDSGQNETEGVLRVRRVGGYLSTRSTRSARGTGTGLAPWERVAKAAGGLLAAAAPVASSQSRTPTHQTGVHPRTGPESRDSKQRKSETIGQLLGDHPSLTSPSQHPSHTSHSMTSDSHTDANDTSGYDPTQANTQPVVDARTGVNVGTSTTVSVGQEGKGQRAGSVRVVTGQGEELVSVGGDRLVLRAYPYCIGPRDVFTGLWEINLSELVRTYTHTHMHALCPCSGPGAYRRVCLRVYKYVQRKVVSCLPRLRWEMCVCVCVCVYLHVCVCVCVCSLFV